MERSRFVNYFNRTARRGLAVAQKQLWRGKRLAVRSLLLLLPCLVQAGTTLVILPTQINLTGPEARQPLILERVVDKEFVGQFTNEVEFVSSDPSVARIDHGTLLPVANGTIKIKA